MAFVIGGEDVHRIAPHAYSPAVKGDVVAFILDVDTVVVAIGNGPNPLVPQTTTGLDVDPRRGTIVTNLNTMRTSKKGVFAGGDIAIGAATVILAMGHGRKAGQSINHYLESGIWDIEFLPGDEPDPGSQKTESK